jgi:hypothetical protein
MDKLHVYQGWRHGSSGRTYIAFKRPWVQSLQKGKTKNTVYP